jgi:hypothetical protein
LKLSTLVAVLISTLSSAQAFAANYRCFGYDEDSGKLVIFNVTQDEAAKELRAEAYDYGVKIWGRYTSAENSKTLKNRYGDIILVLTKTPEGVTADFTFSDRFDVNQAICN